MRVPLLAVGQQTRYYKNALLATQRRPEFDGEQCRIIGNPDFSRRKQWHTAFFDFGEAWYNSVMALLIDGYNLLHATSIFGDAGPGTDLHRSRLALLKFLAASIGERERAQTAIVFDASGAPPGLPRIMSYEGLTVHFARRHSDADEMIEELLEQHPAPRSLTVVSSDHRVQRAARQRGASYVDSAEWYRDLRASRREMGSAGNASAKPAGQMPPDELAYWLGEFDVPAAEDDVSNPFPPGYGEDVTGEE